MAFLAPGVFATAQGAVKLDNMTFDKFLTVPDHQLLVKVDASYAYGEKEDAFKKICEMAYTVPNFFIGELPVQEYGDMENKDMADRFGLKKDDFPAYLLFKTGKTDEYTRFQGFPDPAATQPASWDAEEDGPWEAPVLKDITADVLSKWLRIQGVKFPFPGSIPEFDDLVRVFMTTKEKDKIAQKAKDLAEGTYSKDKKAQNYPRIMRKIIEKGDGYVGSETERVKKLMAGKITADKHAELDAKLKVLDVFVNAQES